MKSNTNRPMIVRMTVMLLAVGVLFGGIFGFQYFKAQMIKKSMLSSSVPPAIVSVTNAAYLIWQPQIRAVGNLRAVRGVDVTSEINGLVRTLYFKSGDGVREGQLLVQLNADSDVAQLRSLEAAADLALSVYERDKKQFEIQAISRAVLDADAADLKSKRAQVAQQAALVEKKSIRSPFAGRLGISTVNPGQYINPGDKIVTLQALESVYVDFYVPQQDLARISLGQRVLATTDTYPGRSFTGKITAIDPRVDPETRNFQAEATFPNPRHELLPGMYACVDVRAGAPERRITLPQTAISYNPYGDTVFVVGRGTGKNGKPELIARQIIVTVGAKRGDQAAILKGVNEGDMVVTSGQIKLKNGSPVVINNKVQPSNEAAPRPIDQ